LFFLIRLFEKQLAQFFLHMNNVTVQLKQESTLRTITGFNKALAISLQRIQSGTFVGVGAQDWVDQIAVGAVGLVIHPLLITAAIGALQQYNALHEVLRSIDYQVRRQQPQAQVSMPPSNLWMPPRILGCRLRICSEESGDLPHVGSWFYHVSQSARPSEQQGSCALACIPIHVACYNTSKLRDYARHIQTPILSISLIRPSSETSL
jgi:hypothetical protein